MSDAWVGVDLDGTLAVYDGWKGIDHIGEPIKPIMEYVHLLVTLGIKVRIFTARCQEGLAAVEVIEKWLITHLGYALPVTDRKDFGMVYLIDDRAVSVEVNTGKFLTVPPNHKDIEWHWSDENPNSPTYKGGK